MSGGEQPDVRSQTRTKAAISVVAPVQDDGGSARGEDHQDDRNDRLTRGATGTSCAGLPSSVIHELRTPLTSIHGYAQVLQRTLRDEPRATNALKVVVRETTRLSVMLAELSELAELEAGDLVVTPIEIDVPQIIDGVVHEIIRRDTGSHPIEIAGSAVACCNPTILSQVLLHVLTNAIRLSPAGSPIEITVMPRGGMVEIAVADRGISVEPADDQRIYEPFERGANVRQTGVRGLGLGLFLARRALAQCGGYVNHESREGGGTVFRVTVPAA
jgi:signal transduction histidine kinase